jgi:hypothetical protein
MPNSAERSEPITATIMIILLFAGFGLLAWAIRHEAETNPRWSTKSINQPVNK